MWPPPKFSILQHFMSMSIFSDIFHIFQGEETFPTVCFAGQFPALGHAPCVETADGRQPIVHPKMDNLVGFSWSYVPSDCRVHMETRRVPAALLDVR